jgi:hypothetical protein
MENLKGDQIRALVDDVIDIPEQPLGVYLFGLSDQGAELAMAVERTVFLEVFGNTKDLLDKEYRDYESSSAFLVVIDHRRRVPAGAMRILVPSPAGFKTFNDVAAVWGIGAQEMIEQTGLSLDRNATWDVATLAVSPEYRGKAKTGLVTIGLFQGLTMMAWRLGIEWLVAVLDMPVFRMIRWKLHMSFSGFTGVAAAPYLGSRASLPVWCRVMEGKSRLAENDPVLHDLLFDGTGMEAAIRPLDVQQGMDRIVDLTRST